MTISRFDWWRLALSLIVLGLALAFLLPAAAPDCDPATQRPEVRTCP